jgi:hypothetical protein
VDLTDKNDELAAVERHIRLAEQLIRRQSGVIGRLSKSGLPTDLAKALLANLELGLVGLLDHRELVRSEIKDEAARRVGRRPQAHPVSTAGAAHVGGGQSAS